MTDPVNKLVEEMAKTAEIQNFTYGKTLAERMLRIVLSAIQRGEVTNGEDGVGRVVLKPEFQKFMEEI